MIMVINFVFFPLNPRQDTKQRTSKNNNDSLDLGVERGRNVVQSLLKSQSPWLSPKLQKCWSIKSIECVRFLNLHLYGWGGGLATTIQYRCDSRGAMPGSRDHLSVICQHSISRKSLFVESRLTPNNLTESLMMLTRSFFSFFRKKTRPARCDPFDSEHVRAIVEPRPWSLSKQAKEILCCLFLSFVRGSFIL